MTDMRIVKVVVTELPKGCIDCDYAQNAYCFFTEKMIYTQDWDNRPTWCPLVKQKDGEE